jgi:signal transduction histidine kinase
VLTHLGEALVPNVDQALIELVKNGYDADATRVDVDVDQESTRSIRITVRDDGVGMDLQALTEGWLVVGDSSKSRERRTPRFHRIQVGDKGLGRLAALRLGRSATVTTQSRSSSKSLRVKIDWDEFRDVRSTDQVDLEIEELPRRSKPGTEIQIEGIRKFSDGALSRVARSLALVSDPFSRGEEFIVRLSGTAVTRKIRKIFDGRFFRYARYVVVASLNAGGALTCRITSKDKRLSKRTVLPGKYETVPFKFTLWEFTLGRESMSVESSPLEKIRDWLKSFGGVHLFDGRIRIAPTGDEPNDWLGLNLLRVRSPEERPSTNNSIGEILLDNSSGRIAQTTDRSSFVLNEDYTNLRKACIDALDWAARTRTEYRDVERQKARAEPLNLKTIRAEALSSLRENLTTEQLRDVRPVFNRVIKIITSKVEILTQDIILYRAMATAGITAAVFSHEIETPIGTIRRRIPDIVRALDEYQVDTSALTIALAATERLGHYIKIPRLLAAGARRKASEINLGEVLAETAELYRPILEAEKISLQPLVAVSSHSGIHASKAMVEAILGNFITNSVTAFRRHLTEGQRRIHVRVKVNQKGVELIYADNAGGIRGVESDRIWNAGVTTKANGTGFGLTIVKDTVADLGGIVSVEPHTPFGGATFHVSFTRVNNGR